MLYYGQRGDEMTNFLLFLIFVFLIAIFVMQFASLLGQTKKNAEVEKKIQLEQELFHKSISIIRERETHFVKTVYTYIVRDESPVVTYLVHNDGSERISVATNKQKSPRLNIYGTDQIKLLGAAIQHQKGSLFDREE